MHSSDWPTESLGDLAEFRNGVNFTNASFGMGAKMIGVGDFHDRFKPRYDELSEIDPTGLVSTRTVLEHGDIVFVRSNGNRQLIGRSMFLDRPPERLIHSAFTIRCRFRSQAVLPIFYAYLFRTPLIRDALTAFGGGTNISNLNQDILGALKVPVPPLAIQHRIASILSAYDDLIENCQRRIRILEDMARGLYREWFVHFRFPGADRLPCVDSPLGPIPQGWQVECLAALMSDHIGGGWGVDVEEASHTLPAWVIRGTDIPAARSAQVGGAPCRFHTQSNLRSRRLAAGDVVFEVSGGSKGQPVGRTMLVTSETLHAFGDDDVICASFCKRIRPDLNRVSANWLYLSFREGYESGEIERFQVQSTGLSNFKWSEYIDRVLRAVPPDDVRQWFDRSVSGLFATIGVLGLKITNLRRTRDLLLPRLMSGQIDVRAGEDAMPA